MLIQLLQLLADLKRKTISVTEAQRCCWIATTPFPQQTRQEREERDGGQRLGKEDGSAATQN